ncbi:hypothetical protein UlMin_035930 [Ulmus minor]
MCTSVNSNNPTSENDQYYLEDDDQEAHWWCGSCWWWEKGDGGSRRHLLQQQRSDDYQVAEENWMVKSAKKAKEISEVVAGPKWKNFIRSFRRCNGNNNISKKRKVQFCYDPKSYKLNFDDGIDRQGDASFSGRYADPLGIGMTKA